MLPALLVLPCNATAATSATCATSVTTASSTSSNMAWYLKRWCNAGFGYMEKQPTTVYFINNEVDLAVNEIMHQLQYHTIKDRIIIWTHQLYYNRSSAVNQGSVNYFLQFLQYQEIYFFIDLLASVMVPLLAAPIAPYHPVRGSFWTCQMTVTIHMHRTTLFCLGD